MYVSKTESWSQALSSISYTLSSYYYWLLCLRLFCFVYFLIQTWLEQDTGPKHNKALSIYTPPPRPFTLLCRSSTDCIKDSYSTFPMYISVYNIPYVYFLTAHFHMYIFYSKVKSHCDLWTYFSIWRWIFLLRQQPKNFQKTKIILKILATTFNRTPHIPICFYSWDGWINLFPHVNNKILFWVPG